MPLVARRPSDLGDRDARHDAAYKRAKQEGFAGRAVYKLQELDTRFGLVGAHKRVLDLGCWPGSWMQYVADRVGPDGLVVGFDLRSVDLTLPPWVETYVADIEELTGEALRARYGTFDLVLSDMAPKTMGDRRTDQLRSEALTQRALELASEVLRPGGHVAAKIFQGPGFQDALRWTRTHFNECKSYHCKQTRAGSREQYIVGRGLKRSTS